MSDTGTMGVSFAVVCVCLCMERPFLIMRFLALQLPPVHARALLLKDSNDARAVSWSYCGSRSTSGHVQRATVVLGNALSGTNASYISIHTSKTAKEIPTVPVQLIFDEKFVRCFSSTPLVFCAEWQLYI